MRPPPHAATSAPRNGGNGVIRGVTRRRHAANQFLMLQNPHRQPASCATSPTRPGRRADWRERTRPARPLQPHFREKVLPARQKTPILGCFERAGRTFSRTRRDNVATLKPTTPLLAPNKEALKPPSPLHPKNAPKTPISRPQRRRRFQSRLGQHPQRRRRFQSRLGQPPQRRRRFQSRLGQHPQRRQGFQSHTSTSEQRRHRFQTTGPLGSRAGRRPWAHKAARHHWCAGRRRDRRARAGFEARRRTK